MRDWLRTMRKNKGLTQMALGKLLGVSDVAIVQWEAGNVLPRYDKMLALADLLGAEVQAHFAAEARAKADGRVA